jgi:hypothetical protein
MKSVGSLRVITFDAYAASHRGVRELKSEGRRIHIQRADRKAGYRYDLSILQIELSLTQCWTDLSATGSSSSR